MAPNDILAPMSGALPGRRMVPPANINFGGPVAYENFQECIDACNACADACDACSSACLGEQDVKMMARCIALDIDCAQLCRLAAAMMARGSEAAKLVCEACVSLCDMCAEECGKHQMQHCQECAAACRKCAAECRQMASA